MFGLFKKTKSLPLITFHDLVSKVIKVNQLDQLASEWQNKGGCERMSISEDRNEITVKIDLDPLTEMIGRFAKTDTNYFMYTPDDFASFLVDALETEIRRQIDKMGILPKPFNDFIQEASLMPLQPEGVASVAFEKPTSFMKGVLTVSEACLFKFYPSKVAVVHKGSAAIKLNVVFSYSQVSMTPIGRNFWILNTVLMDDLPAEELLLPGFKNVVVQDMYNVVKDLGNPYQRVQSFVYKGQFFIVAHGLKESVIYSEGMNGSKNYHYFCNTKEPAEDLSIINRLGKLAKPGLNTFDLGEGQIVRWYKHDPIIVKHTPEY